MPNTTRNADDTDTIEKTRTARRPGRMESALATARNAASQRAPTKRAGAAQRAGDVGEANPHGGGRRRYRHRPRRGRAVARDAAAKRNCSALSGRRSPMRRPTPSRRQKDAATVEPPPPCR